MSDLKELGGILINKISSWHPVYIIIFLGIVAVCGTSGYQAYLTSDVSQKDKLIDQYEKKISDLEKEIQMARKTLQEVSYACTNGSNNGTDQCALERKNHEKVLVLLKTSIDQCDDQLKTITESRAGWQKRSNYFQAGYCGRAQVNRANCL